MEFKLEDALSLLGRTPDTLRAVLHGLPAAWLHSNEGEGTWSPFDVLGHLINGERTNWIPRARVIYEQGEAGTFAPFDRFAHLRANTGRGVDELLDEFAALRAENLATLKAMNLAPTDLERTGMHPEFGTVTLGQLLATWVTHDQAHLVQIHRTLAKGYSGAVGPWRAYLSVLR